MIKVESFYKLLVNNGVDFFSGVPDSLLKDFCAYITDVVEKNSNIIAANEGNATALAAGHHLATGKTGLVYMQNSGLGNAVNPIASLIDPDVYSIPVLFLIGWRGEPGVKDEPQHVKQGKITLELLDVLGVPYKVLPDEIEEVERVIKEAISYLNENRAPYALVVKKETFEKYELKNKITTSFDLSREDALKLILSNIEEDAVVVSTTGMASREVFEFRERLNEGHEKDFLTVGSMGHTSQIALGIALAKPEKRIYCLDGDGAFIMHMGAAGVIGDAGVQNYTHIIINNGAHDSVGGQPTVGLRIDIPQIAKSCGYKTILSAQNRDEIEKALADIKGKQGPTLLEIKVNKGARKDLGRPTKTPLENKKAFMDFLGAKGETE